MHQFRKLHRKAKFLGKFLKTLHKRSSWLPWQIPRLQRIQSSRKKKCFPLPFHKLIIYIRFFKIYPKKLLIVWNLMTWTIFPLRTDPHTNTFMTLEHPCHLFYLNSLSSSSEQWTILMFMFVMCALKEFALNYMYAKYTALMSLGKIKPFHTQSQVTQPVVYILTESSSYANIH